MAEKQNWVKKYKGQLILTVLLVLLVLVAPFDTYYQREVGAEELEVPSEAEETAVVTEDEEPALVIEGCTGYTGSVAQTEATACRWWGFPRAERIGSRSGVPAV